MIGIYETAYELCAIDEKKQYTNLKIINMYVKINVFNEIDDNTKYIFNVELSIGNENYRNVLNDSKMYSIKNLIYFNARCSKTISCTFNKNKLRYVKIEFDDNK